MKEVYVCISSNTTEDTTTPQWVYEKKEEAESWVEEMYSNPLISKDRIFFYIKVPFGQYWPLGK